MGITFCDKKTFISRNFVIHAPAKMILHLSEEKKTFRLPTGETVPAVSCSFNINESSMRSIKRNEYQRIILY